MKTRRHTLAAFTLTAAMFGLAASPATAAQVLIEGTAYNTFAFPNFLESSLTNATTRAWNLGPAAALDQTLNGIALDGPDGGGYDNGLTLSAANTFSGSFLNWGAAPEVAARNNISNTGVFTVSPASWTADITATAGKRYIVEVNSNPVNSTTARSLDVTVDGTLYADNLAVPIGPTYSVVYRFAVIADADGIDLTFSPGADNDINPYVTALSVTEIARVPRLLSVDIASALRATVTTATGPSQFKADLKAVGQNTTNDQIGVWDNGAAPVNFWNYTGFNAAEFTLVDADGKITPVWMTTNASPNTASNWTSGSPDDDLVSDGVFHTNPTTLVTTIGGLAPGNRVDLIVYHSDNFLSELVTVNGVSPVDYTGAMAHPYGDAFDGLTGSDFWYFKAIKIDALGQLVILTDGPGFNTISGFQLIAVPTPAAMPAGLGLLGLLTVRRRR